MPIRLLILLILTFMLGWVHIPQVQAANYTIPPGDSAALIAALQAASDTPDTADVINLAPDSTYTLSEINNSTEEIDTFENEILGGGDQGLPTIYGTITINGNDALIERAADAPDFRFFLVGFRSSLTINGLTLRNGRASNSVIWRGQGGGAILSVGNLTMNDSLLTENYAAGGGGLDSYKGNVAIHRSVFLNNTAHAGAGAILNEYSNFTLDSSSITHNTAGTVDQDWFTYGGGILLSGGIDNISTVTNTTIANNSVLGPYGSGGGVYLINDASTPIEISTNSTITGNYASRYGGGLYSQASNAITIRNVTITDNLAGVDGGGLYTESGGWRFANTLLGNNQPVNCAASIANPLQSLGSNLDSDGSCNLNGSGDLANVDPLLQPLAYNGGLTATQLLLSDSPAIDRGNKARCPLTDQRGILRGTACDIGAFELTGDFIPVRNYYTTNTPQLTWDRVSWATGYQIEVANNNGFHYPEFKSETLSPDMLSVAPTPLMNGIWYWRIHALQPDGSWGRWSPVETIRVEVATP